MNNMHEAAAAQDIRAASKKGIEIEICQGTMFIGL
jgi:hypothetical protein